MRSKDTFIDVCAFTVRVCLQASKISLTRTIMPHDAARDVFFVCTFSGHLSCEIEDFVGTRRCSRITWYFFDRALRIVHHVTGQCFCCCSRINSHNQVRGHRTGSSHSGAEEYPRERCRVTRTDPTVRFGHLLTRPFWGDVPSMGHVP